MFSFPPLEAMAVLSPRMQSTPLMTESAVFALLDQCWYSQSILSHSIALFVLSVESETVVRSSEGNTADATISLAAESSTSQSPDGQPGIAQERTESTESELPRTFDNLDKSDDGLISREALPRTNTGDLADGKTSEEELAQTKIGDHADGLTSNEELSRTDTGDQVSHDKQVYTKYSVTRIPGDGRCLFRAVAHGSSLRGDNGALDDGQQRDLADELRNKVADELVKRRDETEWFIEDDFDVYVNRVRQPNVWGGETELLMLSHVLKMPITVYMADRNIKGGLIAICEYGLEYGTADPVQVLYDGFGHYDAVEIFSEALAPSKL